MKTCMFDIDMLPKIQYVHEYYPDQVELNVEKCYLSVPNISSIQNYIKFVYSINQQHAVRNGMNYNNAQVQNQSRSFVGTHIHVFSDKFQAIQYKENSSYANYL